MFIEMELLARERYESRLREAVDSQRARSLVGHALRTTRAPARRPIPRMRNR